MRVLLASLILSCSLLQCAGIKLTPEQTLAIEECKATVWNAATSEACLGQALAGGKLEVMAISCGIDLAIKALPVCVDIIPTFLTVFQNKDMTFGASSSPKAAADQQTAFGKALKNRVSKALN